MNVNHLQSLFTQWQLTAGFVAFGQAIQSRSQRRKERDALLPRIGLGRKHEGDVQALVLTEQLEVEGGVEPHMLGQHSGVALRLQQRQQVLKCQSVGWLEGAHGVGKKTVQHPVFIVGNET